MQPYYIDIINVLAFVFSVAAEKIFYIVEHMLFTRRNKNSIPIRW